MHISFHNSISFEYMFQQFSTSSNQEIDFQDKESQQITLQFQLKMLQVYGPTLGIYALPNLKDREVWDGMIFIRNGLYKDATFQFQLSFRDFPRKQPVLYFKSSVFHPYVNEKTGQLDVTSTLSDIWNYYNDNMVYNLMRDLKNMFTDKKALSNRFSFNRKAAQLYDQNTHEFITKVMKTVALTSESILQNNFSSPYFITQTKNQEIHELQQMLSNTVKQNTSIESKIEIFINKIMK